jgi:riboflavin kinase/FMN adenylyltransferase
MPDSTTLIPHALDRLPEELTGGVVAIGNFDGLHRGHVGLLENTIAEARRRGVPAVVLTFEPHPRSVFRPETPVFRLTPLPVKALIMSALGLDGIVVIAFDRNFATLTAEEFVEKVLIAQLKIAGAVVGYDFHFGKGRAGSPQMLESAGARLGFPVSVIPRVTEDDGTPISSSAIRAALEAGDIVRANELLGYRWFVIGEVIAGDRRGRELGFPTANIRLPADCRLRHGIYAVTLKRQDGSVHDGVASYGRRPQFDNGPPVLEVHVFDFAGDLYGEEVTVTVLGWIRAEERFPSVEALIAAMHRDSAAARAILASAGPGSGLDRALGAGGARTAPLSGAAS